MYHLLASRSRSHDRKMSRIFPLRCLVRRVSFQSHRSIASTLWPTTTGTKGRGEEHIDMCGEGPLTFDSEKPRRAPSRWIFCSIHLPTWRQRGGPCVLSVGRRRIVVWVNCTTMRVAMSRAWLWPRSASTTGVQRRSEVGRSIDQSRSDGSLGCSFSRQRQDETRTRPAPHGAPLPRAPCVSSSSI